MHKPRFVALAVKRAGTYTATAADLDGSNPHAVAPEAYATSAPWRDRLIGIASEWSPQFPGYLAGAIEAASLGVKALAEFNFDDLEQRA